MNFASKLITVCLLTILAGCTSREYVGMRQLNEMYRLSGSPRDANYYRTKAEIDQESGRVRNQNAQAMARAFASLRAIQDDYAGDMREINNVWLADIRQQQRDQALVQGIRAQQPKSYTVESWRGGGLSRTGLQITPRNY